MLFLQPFYKEKAINYVINKPSKGAHHYTGGLLVWENEKLNCCDIQSQGYYPDIYSAQEKWQEAGQKF